MIDDTQKEHRALARFGALRKHPPRRWDEIAVAELHDIMSDLEAAFQVDLSSFRIPPDRMKPHATSIQRGARSGRFNAHVQQSDGLQCDDQFVLRQIEGIQAYLRASEKPTEEVLDQAKGGQFETAQPEPAAHGAVFSLGRGFHAPTVVPQREFSERRYSLPEAPEELKREFRLLAQESIILTTRGSSNPLRGVDDWMDRLRVEGDVSDGDMERLLCASSDNLRKTRVYELGIGHEEQAESCGLLATRFEDIRARFFGPVEPPVTVDQDERPNVTQLVNASDRKSNTEALVQVVPGQEYPKSMSHATKEPVLVHSAREQAELGPEWSETDIKHAYPGWKRHWTRKECVVKDAKEDAALGGGWANSSSVFEPYRGPRVPPANDQEVIKWVADWPVPNLTCNHRSKIEAALLKADSSFWTTPDAEGADLAAMKLAFDGVAKVLFDAGILTRQLLRDEIPQLIWDSAIAGGWYRFASEKPARIFPEQIGHYYAWRDDDKDWTGLFKAGTAKWMAELLEASPPPQAHAAADNRDLSQSTTETSVAEAEAPQSGPPDPFERQGPPDDGPVETARKSRGRKSIFSRQQLEAARQMKADGKTNNEIAKVLYGANPTDAQRRSVPTTLKHHFGSKNQVEE